LNNTSDDVPVEGREHWTRKDGVRLFLWEKYAGTPQGKPAVLFVHGSSMASQPTFDLAVSGRPDSSVMDWFARRGFTCWTVDMEGYGRSDKSRDIYCDIANGADDLAAATSYIAQASGARQFLTYGISSGALRAALFAQRHPDRVGVDRRGRAHARATTQEAARIPGGKATADRPRLRALDLRARPSGLRRAARGRGVRRRDPRPRRLDAKRHLHRHVL
jgi:pimeloyl-ACP methyl ester carboxylesterase